VAPNGQLAKEKRFDDNGELVAEQHGDEEVKSVPLPRTGMSDRDR